LFSRVKLGEDIAEIRIPRRTGIAGAVFESGTAAIVDQAYSDPRFNAAVDQRTGYRTTSLICVPLRNAADTMIGVVEILNKRGAAFDPIDQMLLQAIADQAATALDHARTFEEQRRDYQQGEKLMELAEAVAVELDLDRLLVKIADAAIQLLGAERSTLFLHDPVTNELWSRVTGGGRVDEIRIRSDAGLAGACFTTARPVSVGDAYTDPRFAPGIDSRTGFRTRTVVCVPILDQRATPVAVLEVLNKRVGQFTAADERRLQTFGSHIATALQNAQLFTDVIALKNYTESLLRSLSDGVIRLDRSLRVEHINEAARKILRIPGGYTAAEPADQLWGPYNPWLAEALAYAKETGGSDHRADAVFRLENGDTADVNVTTSAIRDADGTFAGITMIIQDISREKKIHATITRYMAKEFAERVLNGSELPNGSVQVATVLFSDIRRFTTLTENLTPQATVAMLNEYFSEMAELVQQYGGALDKYIGDAVMAVFGAPVSNEADADNAVLAAVAMVRRLKQLNRRRSSRGARPLEMSIGLASGELAAGPVGSPNRMDYTVIGDSVNLAARLQGANQHYGTVILLAGATVERLAASLRLRRIDLVRVKGKERPTEVFEVLDHYDDGSHAKLDEAVPLFEDGVRFYRERDWSGALRRFGAVLKLLPDDGPSWVYTDRCLYYRDHPPSGSWDGIWDMKTK
jgi:adenylate cyclase